MKPILLGALALPLLLAGCAGTYVGYDDGYGPDYYAYGGPGYYDGVTGDVAVYGYERGNYHSHYHHYDGGSRHTEVASRGVSHESHVASVSHSSGHVSGSSHAAVSSGHERF
ncbi:MAG TPA: hypothetical protein VHY09_04600 [Candidatus Methylacidiphilales bacterium]|jgi:hypothetical protein|nr:hypothetical protein [Candidatus Methylacidiphilales bacterium]